MKLKEITPYLIIGVVTAVIAFFVMPWVHTLRWPNATYAAGLSIHYVWAGLQDSHFLFGKVFPCSCHVFPSNSLIHCNTQLNWKQTPCPISGVL